MCFRTAATTSCIAVLSVTLLVRLGAADPWQHANIVVERDRPARMRDGVTLYADVYRPQGDGAYPALLVRTPYGKEEESLPFVRDAVRRGYVVVVQDVRGEFKSQGKFTPYVQEIDDGYDTIEWVATLPRVNGKVGTFGLSYPGAVQWMTAPSRPPHLRAMVPAMTFANARHFFYDGGAFIAPILNWVLGRQAKDRTARGLPYATADALRAGWAEQSEAWMSYLPLRNLPIQRDYPYWSEWLSHPDNDSYWAPFDIEAQHHLVDVPALNMTAWNEDSYGQPGAIRNYSGMIRNGGSERARQGQRLLIGPWTHGAPMVGRTSFYGVDYGPSAALDYSDVLLQFFDYWLKDIDDRFSNAKPIKIFVMGDNVWREEAEWPPARTEYRELNMEGDGRLTRDVPAHLSPDTFVYDPRNPVRIPFAVTPQAEAAVWKDVTARRDVLSYTTPALERDTEITGQILGKLWVTSTAPDTDFTMRLLDVSPDGARKHMTEAFGMLRARYRSTEKEQSPQPLPRGSATELTIGMGYTSRVVPAGHRLQVVVMSSVFPYVNLNTWEQPVGMTQAISATQTVFHDPEHRSRVVLPIIPR